MADARRPGSARRLAGVISGVAAAVLCVAGCVSMPDSGPPSSLPVNQSDAGQSQDYVGPFPAGPENHAGPQEIVQGFLLASASYYTAGDTVRSYLTPQAAKTWNPEGSVTVSSGWSVNVQSLSGPTRQQQAAITVSGLVQAKLSSTGQLYASAVQNGANVQSTSSPGGCESSGQAACYSLTLVKSGGQWRIANAPPSLLLDQTDFERAWEPQDLYFFDSSKQVLVPDSVFVPIGTSETELLNKLAAALQKGPPSWLLGGTVNVFPAHITSLVVNPDNSVAIVNLKGSLSAAEQNALGLISAELVWTLTSATVSQPGVQSVELEVNGAQWKTPQSRGPYTKNNPYQSQPANFSYIDPDGTAQWLCGSIQNAAAGPPVPVFGRTAGDLLPQCSATAPLAVPTSPAQAQSTPSSKPGHSAKPAKRSTANTYSMVAVSPDGRYVATVSAAHNVISAGLLQVHTTLKPLLGPDSGITAISWDRQDDLWVVQAGSVWLVPMTGPARPVYFPGTVTALSVAPDGVRVAAIVQDQATGAVLDLAAIDLNGNASSKPAPHGTGTAAPAIGQTVPLGPGITGAVALSWYNADNLIVLNQFGASRQLEEVPVDGRASTTPLATLQTPVGVSIDSIAAGNSSNVLVVGLSNGQLWVTGVFEGPWQNAGRGYAPSYRIPPAT